MSFEAQSDPLRGQLGLVGSAMHLLSRDMSNFCCRKRATGMAGFGRKDLREDALRTSRATCLRSTSHVISFHVLRARKRSRSAPREPERAACNRSAPRPELRAKTNLQTELLSKLFFISSLIRMLERTIFSSSGMPAIKSSRSRATIKRSAAPG